MIIGKNSIAKNTKIFLNTM